jgi:hypothetical protein
VVQQELAREQQGQRVLQSWARLLVVVLVRDPKQQQGPRQHQQDLVLER